MTDPDFLADLHFRDFRHEATSRMASIFNMHELMKIVGHSSSAMLQRYYHPMVGDFAQRLRERESSIERRRLAMPETFAYIGKRFVKGLREAPYEFVAPLIVAARGAKFVARFASRHLDAAMAEARAKANCSNPKK